MGTPRGMATCGAAAMVAAVAAAGGASLLRRRLAPSRTAVCVRRDLAIAYEDSGIELLDNGKFAQGIVGGEGAWGKYEFDPVGFSKFTELVPYFQRQSSSMAESPCF